VTADGTPPPLRELDDRTVAALLPERPERGHKGTFGKLLVLAGSLDHLGAALLAARAAGRAGTGLVILAVPASLQPLAAGRVPEVVTMGLPETEVEGEVDPEPALDRLLDTDHDAAILGPGLRPGLATVELVGAYLGTDGAGVSPACVDAEALNSLASLPDWPKALRRRCVLTPHVGEFRRLQAGSAELAAAAEADLVADDEARADVTRSAAGVWGQVLVLKGARTVIAGPDGRTSRAPWQNPALASGGTGDVLAGTVGALLAQGCEPFEAACAGVYLHGAAGEVVRDRFGDAGLLASDLPDEIARARKRLAAAREARRGAGRLGFSADRDVTSGGDRS